MRCIVTLALLASATAATAAPPRALPGWPLYERLCSACHGADGDGKGPASAFAWGDPRAFADGQFEWRSTPIGSPPTDDDLRLAIRRGAAGTSMPAFRLDDAQVDALIAVVKAFAPAAFAAPGQRVALGAPPAVDAARGAALWGTLGCAACHGPAGRGDGPAAAKLREPPYDLQAFPVRRPHEPGDERRAAATSIATGLAGTGMPGFLGAVPEADLWALADHVLALGAAAGRRDRSALDADTIDADRATKAVVVGTWPGAARDPDAALFGAAVPAQGTTALPAELASLAPSACARCHPKQAADWGTSLHGGAASPGLIAQLDYGLGAAESASCRRCHTPLAEQRTDLALRATGVSCGGCHVRGWTRHGPPNVAPELARAAPAGYPLVTQGIYARADFCLPCHQLPPRTAVNGKPLLNTYKEWMEGPYPGQGIACQDCHMEKRAHLWRGVHDPDMVRRALDLAGSATRAGDKVTVLAELRNRGAGHYVPTTATPGLWLWIELLDARGAVLATSGMRIGRDVYYDGAWHERADTRIPPGERAVMARAWTQVAGAASVRITVEVRPDELYEGIYAARLAREQPAPARALYEQALARARGSHYIAERRVVPITAAVR